MYVTLRKHDDDNNNGVADETVDHLISGCSFLVQREYKGRHDAIASLIYWTFLKQAGIQVQAA